MKKGILLAAVIGAVGIGSANASTTMPLNSGYNHAIFAPYPMPTSWPSPFQDQYWIKIASYEPPLAAAPVAPAWTLNRLLAPATPWPAPGAASQWIGPRSVALSSPGAMVTNPAYSIFRKCFCLMANYKNPSLAFNVRADDNVQVWLNAITNTLVSPQNGHYLTGSQPIQSTPTNAHMFHAGRNCVYVLVEDFLGHMGFTLTGSVTADGLMPVAAYGVNMSFAPCECSTPHPGGGAAGMESAAQEQATVQSIVRLAEFRRLEALRVRLPITMVPKN